MEKTVAIQLQELREQIAQDIESSLNVSLEPPVVTGYYVAILRAAEIARGKK